MLLRSVGVYLELQALKNYSIESSSIPKKRIALEGCSSLPWESSETEFTKSCTWVTNPADVRTPSAYFKRQVIGQFHVLGF
jgi:hypothetical protein